MSSGELDPRIDDALARDPEIAVAKQEVDRSLIRWMLALSPLARLRAVQTRIRGLRRFKRVAPERS